ncbi:hypothetical protein NLJ89_g8452 [Agrocybe chaxingu]|uniref:MHD domain-containing protein n=1 Tax=Agrocybe chaxingu TaxID=84603 RepID=A0A9W8MUH3_9AGAR|nr:hypothetical protein NLJ89_g8452 [Agrocybe chaxingu]
MAAPNTFRKHFLKNWFAVEAIPIYVIIGGVLTGATWYMSRLAFGPNIVWTKSNPTPWNSIKPDEGTKLVQVNQKFDKSLLVPPVLSRINSKDERRNPFWSRSSVNINPIFYATAILDFSRAEEPPLSVYVFSIQLVTSRWGGRLSYVRPIDTLQSGTLNLPVIVYGAGAFSNQYNTDDHLASETPLRTIRLALRYGIRAFDTSVYYGPSEIVLGNALHALREEFPRSSYQIMTKCGRYGTSTFDYSPTTIRESVKHSLDRLKTDYLDTVYLHDVEFVCTPVAPRTTGNHTTALKEDAVAYGLAVEDKATVRGEGDQKILDAFHELQALKSEGLVKNIGITGFPLPTLLRLAILILHTTPFQPVDVLLSYSHLCLQNSTFLEFIPHFYERAKVGQLLAASPLSMGLLTSSPPAWHPAPPPLRQAVVDASKTWSGDFPSLAVGYSLSHTSFEERPLHLVLGFSTPREVHEAVKVWREIQEGTSKEARRKGEEQVREVFKNAGRPIIQSGFRSTSPAYPLLHIEAVNDALSKAAHLGDVDPVVYVPAYTIGDAPTACCHVQHADIRILCPISGNVDPLFGFAFLQTFVDILQEYFGTLSAESLKDNFDVLLEETLDSGGHPLTTTPNALRDIVLPPSLLNKLLSVAGANISSTINSGSGLGAGGPFSSPIPWRKAGLRYSSNEVYFDVVEELKAVVNKNGVTLSNNVFGKIETNCRLSGTPDCSLTFSNPNVLADCAFHPCVRLQRWAQNKTFSFVPPDGKFVLVEYRYSPSSAIPRVSAPSATAAPPVTNATRDSVPIPFIMKAKIEVEDNSASFDITLTSRLTTRPLENLVIDFNLGEEASGIKCIAARGTGGLGRGGTNGLDMGHGGNSGASWAFDSRKKILRWEIHNVPSSSSWNLRGSFSTP